MRERTADGLNRPFLETENTYSLRNVDTGAEPADGASTTATIFPMLTRTDRRFYEGQASPGKSTYTTHKYDAYGNVTEFADAGDTGAADDVLAKIQYANCPDTYILGKPSTIEVYGSGALMRHRTAQIDCATGDVTQVAQYLASGEAAVTDLSYYPNGNLKKVIGPPNVKGERYTLAYAYDPVVETHIARIRDSFVLTSQATHNYKYGKAEVTTDVNGNQTQYDYDQYGRVARIFGPYEAGGATPTLSFDYHPEAPVPYALTRHLDQDADGNPKPSGTIDTVLFTVKGDATLYLTIPVVRKNSIRALCLGVSDRIGSQEGATRGQ